MQHRKDRPDKKADLPFPFHLLPLLQVFTNDAILKLYICGQNAVMRYAQGQGLQCVSSI